MYDPVIESTISFARVHQMPKESWVDAEACHFAAGRSCLGRVTLSPGRYFVTLALYASANRINALVHPQ